MGGVVPANTNNNYFQGKIPFTLLLVEGTAPAHINWTGATVVKWEGWMSTWPYTTGIALGHFDSTMHSKLNEYWSDSTDRSIFLWEGYHTSTPYDVGNDTYTDIAIPLITCHVMAYTGITEGSYETITYTSTSEKLCIDMATNRPWIHYVAHDIPLEGPGHYKITVYDKVVDYLLPTAPRTVNSVLNADGEGDITMNDTYHHDLYLHAYGALWKKFSDVTFSTTSDVDLGDYYPTFGDIDSDNSITVYDIGYISDNFDKTDADEDWFIEDIYGVSPSSCDLDGDGAVTVYDYGIVSDNFDLSGDELP